MFERFTEKSVKVIMLAQEESRRLGYNFVGTEQLLLGLIGEETGFAAWVLKSLGVTLEAARTEVEKFIGRGRGFVSGEIPFTPRAKAVQEMALSECRELKHGYIGTEHLLLAIVREGERIMDLGLGRGPTVSLAFQVLQNLGVEPSSIQTQVMQVVGLGGGDSVLQRLSMQPYKEPLRELLPQISSQALRVWHALGSQMSWEDTDWEDTDIEIPITKLMQITNLTEPKVQAALDELVTQKVITRIEPD